MGLPKGLPQVRFARQVYGPVPPSTLSLSSFQPYPRTLGDLTLTNILITSDGGAKVTNVATWRLKRSSFAAGVMGMLSRRGSRFGTVSLSPLPAPILVSRPKASVATGLNFKPAWGPPLIKSEGRAPAARTIESQRPLLRSMQRGQCTYNCTTVMSAGPIGFLFRQFADVFYCTVESRPVSPFWPVWGLF